MSLMNATKLLISELTICPKLVRVVFAGQGTRLKYDSLLKKIRHEKAMNLDFYYQTSLSTTRAGFKTIEDIHLHQLGHLVQCARPHL